MVYLLQFSLSLSRRFVKEGLETTPPLSHLPNTQQNGNGSIDQIELQALMSDLGKRSHGALLPFPFFAAVTTQHY
jgi:hypothetical protein